MVSIGKTDVGKMRNNNEDSFFLSNERIGVLPNLFVIADGLGGHNAGEVASNNSILFFKEYLESISDAENGYLDIMISGLIYANSKIYGLSLSNEALKGMGTTFSACTIDDNKMYIAHIGDSRIYNLTSSKLEQITNDHTYVNEMLKAGQLTPSEIKNHPNRNSLLKALGTHESIEADGNILDIGPIKKILLCSDGLSNMLTDSEIHGILDNDDDINVMVDRLIAEANSHGGHDNISVVLIDLGR